VNDSEASGTDPDASVGVDSSGLSTSPADDPATSTSPTAPPGSATTSALPDDPTTLRPQHARRRRVHRFMLLSLVVPGTSPVPPWPASGQAAVAIPALGYAAQSGPEQSVPIASLAKMTTAVVVLRDHPVPLGSSGPTITITPGEAAQFGVDLANDETNVPLVAGETLTELQLLEALIVQSANDAAYTLAQWDAGSQEVFVDKMNALALSIGAVHSHYVDTSGFDPRTVSTAADTLRIAAAGMAIPTFADVAGMAKVNLPGVGMVNNIVTKIGTDGIIGVKSGYTSQASGCMVLAGMRSIYGRSVLVLASALGQKEPTPPPPPPILSSAPGPSTTAPPTTTAPALPTTTTTTVPYNPIEAQYPLLYTEPIVEHLLDVSEAAIVPVPVVADGQVVGAASTEWGGSRRVVPVAAARGAWLLGIPGQLVTATMTSMAPSGKKTGTRATGAVRYTLGSQTENVPVRLVHHLPEPGWWWKVIHD
jgi:D-alanyl-D-alanine carboxypeptidase